MEQVKKVGIVILILLLIIIASLEGFYIMKSRETKPNNDENESVIIYKGHEFLVENIDNKLPDYIKLEDKEIIANGHTLLLNISTYKDIINSKIIIEYYDENNNLVEKSEQYIGVLFKNNKFIVESNMPILNNQYSGKIKITMETMDFDNTNYDVLDKNMLKLETSTNSDSTTNDLNINIQGTNPFNEKITNLSGYVLLYEKDKIINIAYFTNEGDIEVGANINIDAIAYPIEGNTINYDNIEIVINYLY